MLKKTLGALACSALLIGLGFAGHGRAEPRGEAGPTFSCKSPTEVEAVVCQDTALSAADRRMAALYQAAKLGPLKAGSNQLAAQRSWLKGRTSQCGSGAWKKGGYRTLHDCVASSYSERLKALAVADLLATPQLSLLELRTLAPKSAPYYGALLKYATIDDPAERRRALEAELAPLYASMTPEVRGGLKNVGNKATTARDAASSDAGFAQFLDVSAVLGDVEVTWPCAALIRRPGLIVGLGSIFGGAIDGQLPSSDCEEALPSPSELTSLANMAFDAQPPCDGTIRFSTSRAYAMLEDAVRLRQRDIWQAIKGPPSKEETAFRRKNTAIIDRTAAALSAYYSRYFASGSQDAAADGRTAASALVSAAFGYCD